MSLEDEIGTSNVVIWNSTRQRFRAQILTGKLLAIKSTVEILKKGVSVPVIPVIAGHIEDLTPRARSLAIKAQDFY